MLPRRLEALDLATSRYRGGVKFHRTPCKASDEQTPNQETGVTTPHTSPTDAQPTTSQHRFVFRSSIILDYEPGDDGSTAEQSYEQDRQNDRSPSWRNVGFKRR
ncbi:hypothetical protein CBL_05087 [Carabus blaptoides fortunei]